MSNLQDKNKDKDKHTDKDLLVFNMANNQHTDKVLLFFYSNLDTIAIIKNGNKIYLSSDNCIKIDEPYMFQGIWRYCNNVSRKDAVYILNKLFNDIEIYFNAMYVKNIGKIGGICKLSEPDNKAFMIILNKIELSLVGVNNLKLTYSDDENICKEFDKIIDKGKMLKNTFSKLI